MTNLTKTWRIFVLEDCGELLQRPHAGSHCRVCSTSRTESSDRAGGCLICITTNEPIARLHPAVVRPGRCLATIEVRSFTAREARQWLGPHHRTETDMTLAEMFARRSGQQIVVKTETDDLGYL